MTDEEQASMTYAINVLEHERFPRSPAGAAAARANREHIAVLKRIAHGGVVEF